MEDLSSDRCPISSTIYNLGQNNPFRLLVTPGALGRVLWHLRFCVAGHSGEGLSGIAVVTCGGGSQHRSIYLPTWRTASYFSSRPTAATNPSHNRTAIPGTSGHEGNLVHPQRHGQAGALAQTSGESPQKIARFFLFEALCTAPHARRRPRASPASRTRGPGPCRRIHL